MSTLLSDGTHELLCFQVVEAIVSMLLCTLRLCSGENPPDTKVVMCFKFAFAAAVCVWSMDEKEGI